MNLADVLSWSVVVDAVTLGALYALIAVGYTMVYGIIQLINFAHGEVFMFGTYVALLVALHLGVPLLGAIVISMTVCAMLGLVLDFTAYLPLRRKQRGPDRVSLFLLVVIGLLAIYYFQLTTGRTAPDANALLMAQVLLTALPAVLFVMALLGLAGKLGRPQGSVHSDRLCALITAIGMSLSLQTLAQLIWTADYRLFRDDLLPAFLGQTVFELGSARVMGKELVIWIAATVLMAGLGFLVARTRMGRAMRACALDKQTAALMGVNVNVVIGFTFMIGSAMAAVAGVLYAIKVGGNISPRMGYYPGVIAFAAAVLGGIGSIRGAVAGGLIIGFTQAVGSVVASAYDFAFAFGLMVLVIMFRPWGIFGKAEAKRA